ncbi:MAG: transglycosylase SLT domain-containing protein [Sphingorhabdus sp.]
MNRTSPLNGPDVIAPQILRAIDVASRRTGTDFDYLLNQARIESSFRPDARAATSSAVGLYQFTNQTWLATMKRHGAEHGYGWAADAVASNRRGVHHVADPAMREAILDLRSDPALAALMAGEHAADNRNHLVNALGREPEPVDLYLAHFLGASGAESFLKAWLENPSQPAASLFREAASTNRAIFHDSGGRARSLDEIRRAFANKLARGGAASAHLAERSRSKDQMQIFTGQGALDLLPIEPMPQRLSIDFALGAYRKLAGAGAGR